MRRWLKVDLNFFSDDKVLQLTHSEQVLYLKLMMHSAACETEGELTWEAIQMAGKGHRTILESCNRMVALGLLSSTGSAQVQHRFNIVRYTEWQGRSKELPGHSVGRSGPSRAGAREEKRIINSSEGQVQQAPVLMNLDGALHQMKDGQWRVVDGEADTA